MTNEQIKSPHEQITIREDGPQLTQPPIVISMDYYMELKKAEAWLWCLEDAGVND